LVVVTLNLSQETKPKTARIVKTLNVNFICLYFMIIKMLIWL
jgi:hypothetical protein